MRISRVFVVASVFVACAFTSAAVILSSSDAEAADKKIQFSGIAENDTSRLGIDLESVYSAIDSDGDLLVGAITQVASKGDQGQAVYAVVAICGYNGMIVLRSRTFDKEGRMIAEKVDPEPLAELKPGTMAGITYAYLCKAAPKPAPKPAPSYKAPDRYKNLWI